jgi:DNA-binding MarR family transcriptional regulator
MVVRSKTGRDKVPGVPGLPEAPQAPVDPARLDIAYLGFFLGLRVNELVLEKGVASGFRGMRESHGYLVQHLIESERSITELARRMNVSQQAASKSIAELVKGGVVESRPAKDRRARRVRLSKRGWDAVRSSRRARQTIEARLQHAVGEKAYDDARATLIACLDALGGLSRVRTRRIRSPR